MRFACLFLSAAVLACVLSCPGCGGGDESLPTTPAVKGESLTDKAIESSKIKAKTSDAPPKK